MPQCWIKTETHITPRNSKKTVASLLRTLCSLFMLKVLNNCGNFKKDLVFLVLFHYTSLSMSKMKGFYAICLSVNRKKRFLWIFKNVFVNILLHLFYTFIFLKKKRFLFFFFFWPQICKHKKQNTELIHKFCQEKCGGLNFTILLKT